jgi:hypothetical protein
MSLLADFDLVTEISNETILKLIRTNLNIGGVSPNPPFEITIPGTGGGANGSAHLVVTGIHLDLNADDTATLTFEFTTGSVQITSPLKLTVCPLEGNIAVQATLTLKDAPGQIKALSFAITGATINFSASANQAISDSLAGSEFTPAQFQSFANQAITGFVLSAPIPTLPVAFKVVPGANGSFMPSLVFERLEVHCIPNANRSKQALGLFGILLAANNAQGNHNNKTTTAITAANDGICISISPQVFHTLIFCPGLASE